MSGLFSMQKMLKHWSLIPVTVSCAAGTVMCAVYVGYMCGWKSDLSFMPWKYGSHPRYLDVPPTKTIRFYKYERLPIQTPDEILALRKEINLAVRE